LGVFSEGFLKFQLGKLTNTGIEKYFSKKHLYIFRRKLDLKNLKEIPSKAVIIDDKQEVFDGIKSNLVLLIDRKKQSLKELLSKYLN